MAATGPARRRSEHLIDRLVTAFEREVRARDPQGVSLTRLDDLDDAAAVAARVVVDTSDEWRKHLGGFYTAEAVGRLLGAPSSPLTKQAVSKRHGLLKLETGSRRVVYPRFQFVDGQPVERIGEVLDLLPEKIVSRWTVASWLVSKNPELGEARPIDVLADGRAGTVLEAARSWAASLRT